MRYLIDEDLSTDVAQIARGLGLDAVSVQEVGRRQWTDEQLLSQAAQEDRCIVTGNRDDFRRLTTQFAAENRPHAGVLVASKPLRDLGATRIARSLAEFDNARGDFPAEYLFDFLRRAD